MIRALFSIYQSTNHSNGGVNSMTQILEQDASIEPVIFTNRVGPFNARWKAKGWKIISSNINWGSREYKQGSIAKVLDLVKSNLLAYKTLKKNKLKILYCNDVQGFWCAYFGGKMAGVKIVFNLRDTKSAEELSSLGKWKYIVEKSDVVVVLSEEMKDFVVTKLLDNKGAEKVFVTYSIVNQEVFKPVDADTKKLERAELGIADDEFVVSYVATFNEKKAQLAFIQQLIVKFKGEPKVRFYFIGDFTPNDNVYAQKCLDAVNELGIAHQVTFVGHDSRVDRWYKVSNVVAIASTKEGLARCMIEAVSCGTPVISFDVCSAREILEQHECGEVVTMGDYTGFYDKIKLFMQQPALTKAYGENGSKLADKLFNRAAVIKKYQSIYEKINKLA